MSGPKLDVNGYNANFNAFVNFAKSNEIFNSLKDVTFRFYDDLVQRCRAEVNK
jgi:hypothetical protein